MLFAKIARGLYYVPDCLSARAQCLIHALLQKDPNERITCEDVLLHPWLKQKDDLFEEPSNREALALNDQQVPEWIPTAADGDSNLNPSDTNRLCKKLFA